MDIVKKSHIKVISTQHAAEPLGHYSQAIVHHNLIYISGQLPIDPIHPNKKVTSIEEETVLTLNNIQAILNEAGSDLMHVLKVTIYISDLSLWSRMNAAYASFFGDHKPARSAVPTKDLPKGFHIEMDAIAALI